MTVVYFDTFQLVLVAEKNCVGIVGKIGKSIGKHDFSSDSDAVWMVFVQLPLAADDFVDFFHPLISTFTTKPFSTGKL